MADIIIVLGQILILHWLAVFCIGLGYRLYYWRTSKAIFVWYDFWWGLYLDREKDTLYWLSLPCLGFKIYMGDGE